MSRRIVFLINPISGTRKKTPLKSRITSYMKRVSIPFELLDTHASGDYAWLREKIVNEKITDIVICGGDGSVNSIGSHLLGLDVNTGIIPMGSGNGLALCAGIPRNTRAALDLIINGKAGYIDGFFINNRFSCMLCGIGFDARVAHAFSRQQKRGPASYIRLSVKHFFSSRSYPFTLLTEGRVFDTEAYFISIANSNQFGNNFTIAPRASLSDGLLDIVVVKKMSRFRLPFAVLKQVSGYNSRQSVNGGVKNRKVLYFQTPSLTILNRALAPLHIDGEPEATAEKFEIRIAPGALRLLRP